MRLKNKTIEQISQLKAKQPDKENTVLVKNRCVGWHCDRDMNKVKKKKEEQRRGGGERKKRKEKRESVAVMRPSLGLELRKAAGCYNSCLDDDLKSSIHQRPSRYTGDFASV